MPAGRRDKSYQNSLKKKRAAKKEREHNWRKQPSEEESLKKDLMETLERLKKELSTFSGS